MNRSTIQHRLRLGIPEVLLLSVLSTVLLIAGRQTLGDDDTPKRTRTSQPLKASRPLTKSNGNAPALKPPIKQTQYWEAPSVVPRRYAAALQAAQAQQDNGEFDYPLDPLPGTPPVPGSAPLDSDPTVEEPNVVDPLFGSMIPEGVPVEPEPGFLEPEYYYPDQWSEHLEECEDCEDGCFGRCSPWYRLFHLGIDGPRHEHGIGQERVMFAPFIVDVSQPQQNYRLRFDMVYGVEFPDRAEYFFAKPSKGPKFIEREVDYQDIRFQFETGGELFSVFTDLPVRVLDPVINDNTAGFGDMVVGNKAVLINGRFWQLTQVLRTYINTADSFRGLGTGHTSMEPGLILRYKWTNKTYLHAELKYLTPVGADPMFSGPLINYGFSWATVLYETDTFAILPTLEFTGTSVLDGLKTRPLAVALDGSIPNVDPTRPILGTFPFVGQPEDVDGENFGTVQSGVRFVLGPKGDLGLLEVGMSAGISTANNAFYDYRALLEFRWSY